MTRLLNLGVQFLARFVLFPLYAATWLVPRRDDLWVFGSWGGYRYADNAAAFFRHCHQSLNDVELVWISRRRDIVARLRREGYQAAWIGSPKGIACCLRAGTYLFDCFAKDINFWTSGGARLVNLWSGVPLKTFERDIDHPGNRYYRLFHGNPVERFLYGMMMPWHAKRPDYIIAMSEETAEITRRAFDLDASQVLVTGFPRNDALFQRTPPAEMPEPVIEAVRAGRRVFLYLPTFRDSGKPFLRIDWDRLDLHMRKLNAVFFCKFHPVDASQLPQERANVKGLPQDVDVYGLLPHADVLISDYSSIIFDYMLLGRSIVYYAPDVDEFVAENRALNFDPREIAVGPVCRTFGELLEALNAAGSGDATAGVDPAHREAIESRLHAFRDGRSCDRVLRALLSIDRPARVTAGDGVSECLQRTPQQGQ